MIFFLLKLKTDDDDDYYTDSDDIVSRTQFPESFLWEEFDLPNSIGNY